MSAAIGPGDWVERVTPSPENGFVVGALYQLSEVTGPRPCGGCSGCPGVLIAGWPKPFGALYYASCAFRPIYRPNSELVHSLLQPSPELVNEGVLEEADG